MADEAARVWKKVMMNRTTFALVVSTLAFAGCYGPPPDAQQGSGGEATGIVYCNERIVCANSDPCALVFCEPVEDEPNPDDRWGVCKTTWLPGGSDCNDGHGYCSSRVCVPYHEPPPVECRAASDCGDDDPSDCEFVSCNDGACARGSRSVGSACGTIDDPGVCGVVVSDDGRAEERCMLETSNP